MTTIEKLNKDIFIQRDFYYVLLPENKNLKEYEILSFLKKEYYHSRIRIYIPKEKKILTIEKNNKNDHYRKNKDISCRAKIILTNYSKITYNFNDETKCYAIFEAYNFKKERWNQIQIKKFDYDLEKFIYILLSIICFSIYFSSYPINVKNYNVDRYSMFYDLFINGSANIKKINKNPEYSEKYIDIISDLILEYIKITPESERSLTNFISLFYTNENWRDEIESYITNKLKEILKTIQEDKNNIPT